MAINTKSTLEGKTNTMSDKEVNYTEAMVDRMHAVADANGGVIDNELALELATEFDKDVRSVRAKAVREGIYKAKEKTAKNGQAIERKEAIVAEIATLVGANVDGLEKATKTALQRVRDALKAA